MPANMPFKVLVDGTEMPNGSIPIHGNELTVIGRSNAEFQYPLLRGQDPNYVHPFHLFSVPLAEHRKWRDELRECASENSTLTIEERYFGNNGFLLGRNCTRLTTAIQAGRLYRVHYVGRDNGFPEDDSIQGSCCYYTSDEARGLSGERSRDLAKGFSLQEIV